MSAFAFILLVVATAISLVFPVAHCAPRPPPIKPSLSKSPIPAQCQMQPEKGEYQGEHLGVRCIDRDELATKYFYNISLEHCLPFPSYKCRTNDNRFETMDDCEVTCNKWKMTTTVKPKPKSKPAKALKPMTNANVNSAGDVAAASSNTKTTKKSVRPNDIFTNPAPVGW